MSPSTLHNRLAAMEGDEAAHELATTPNANLGGFSPLDLLERGQFEPVRLLLEGMELNYRTCRDFLPTFPHEFSPIDYQAAAL